MISTKKGVGPVIAALILLVVATIISLIILNYSQDFISQSQVQAQEVKDESVLFSEVMQSNYNQTLIKNPLESINISGVYLNGMDCNISGVYTSTILDINISYCTRKLRIGNPTLTIQTSNGPTFQYPLRILELPPVDLSGHFI